MRKCTKVEPGTEWVHFQHSVVGGMSIRSTDRRVRFPTASLDTYLESWGIY